MPVDDTAALKKLRFDRIKELRCDLSVPTFPACRNAHEVLHYLILVDHPASVFLIPAVMATAVFDDVIDGKVFQARALG